LRRHKRKTTGVGKRGQQRNRAKSSTKKQTQNRTANHKKENGETREEQYWVKPPDAKITGRGKLLSKKTIYLKGEKSQREGLVTLQERKSQKLVGGKNPYGNTHHYINKVGKK